ncbi:coagulation factor V [Discoglossus pictus]
MDPGKAGRVSCLACLLLAVLGQVTAIVREHYIAAVMDDWDYKKQHDSSKDAVFKKMMYREYTAGFQKAKPHPELSGILGPTLRAEVGDTLKVHFKNMADKPLTIHPQGIAYGKMSEGTNYKDNTQFFEKMDDSVLPGHTYTYIWEITEDIGPKKDDPYCLTYTYYSHENMVQDFNSGLIGALLICKEGSLIENGRQKHFDKDYVLMFAVFDESKSWRAFPSKQQGSVMYTINGYTNGTMPDVDACVGDLISWHFIGMSSRPELFSVHIFGQTLEENQHKVAVLGLVAGASKTANMTITYNGKWLISSLVEKHVQAGMHGYLNADFCSFKDTSFRKYSLYQKRYIKNWEYFIAAEEVMWDYAANVENKDRMQCQQKYKKVIYRQYTDNTFTKRLQSPTETGLLGPVIRAQVRDTITVVFKNMASQPYSIYPHGVSLQKSSEGTSYPPDLQGNQTQNQAVMPGETTTYNWHIHDTDEPTSNDPRCLTRIYHSAVNFTKDIASGLIGPLLICKSMSLNTRGVQKKADLEQIAMFTVFDENKSWYQEENKDKFCNMIVDKDQTHSYNSNIIRTINGYVHENTLLGFCHDHVVQWHVSSVGTQDEIIGVQLGGHSFTHNGRSGDVVNLYPMSGESISVEMDNVGVWLFGTLLFPKRNHGMKLRFRDAKCKQQEDDYEYDIFSFDSTEIVPKQHTNIDNVGSDEETIDEETNDGDMDYNEYLALKFDIRSFKNKTTEDIEQLNLTALGIEDTQDSLTENINVSTSGAVMKDTVDYSSNESNELFKAVQHTSEEGKSIDHEVTTLPYTDLNVTASDISREFNSTNNFVGNGIELQITSKEEESLNKTKEIDEDLIMTKIYNSTDLEADQQFFTLVEEISDLNISRTNSSNDKLIDIEEIQDSPQPVNKSDMEVKSLIKRSAEYTKENSTSVPLGVNHFLGKVIANLSSLSKNKIEYGNNPNFIPENSTMLPKLLNYTKQSAKEVMESNPTGTSASYLHDTNSVEDYEDIEFKELFGSQVLEDIMKVIFDHKQNNETWTDEDHLVEHEKQHFEDFTQSLTKNATKNKDSSKKKGRSKVKPVQNNTLTTGSVSLIRRRKKAGNKDSFQKDVPALNGYKQNNSMVDTNETLASNKSENSDNGETVFSPRGFKPHVIIGVPKLSDGDYMEYDMAITGDPDDEASYEYVPFENPYEAASQDYLDRFTNPDVIAAHYLRSSKGRKRIYYIAAEEVYWDYSGLKKSMSTREKPSADSRSAMYTKVIYRQYLDNSFTKPAAQGEYEQHLGILGPVIRAEVDDVIQVTFKNLATRPYSLHAHGVSYEKFSEGRSYNDETLELLKKDDAVNPGETHVYVWYATQQSGPDPEGSACRAWAYYSGVNPERDIHSGLIGPLLICRNGTLDIYKNRPLDAREFILLFMTFEEDKSWYFEKNVKKTCTPPIYKNCHTYHAINGIVYNLQGLQMYHKELVRWHMLNMGGPKDIHVAHFHGQTFIVRNNKESQHGVYPLLPGSFATIEMRPSRVGQWLLDTEVAEYQDAGMQAKFHVIDSECKLPMGLEGGLISDNQITASHFVDYWNPYLARLNNVGSYNAWSTEMKKSALPWIQVDMERQVVISGIQTQGAYKYMKQYYITEFFIAYSKDNKKWNAFKGNSTTLQMLFDGNTDYSTIKENIFDPPIVARYIKIYPTKFYNRPTLRLELLGCELEGCFTPLGLESNIIKDEQITASSYKSSWIYSSWKPSLARLNMPGRVNAWQAKSNNNQQWLQIDFLKTKRISGIVTQGASSFPSEMFVKSYAILYSDNGKDWKPYTDGSSSMEKEFKGNTNTKGQVKNVFSPPIFSQFLRIVPKSWNQSISMRVEIYGCDT